MMVAPWSWLRAEAGMVVMDLLAAVFGMRTRCVVDVALLLGITRRVVCPLVDAEDFKVV